MENTSVNFLVFLFVAFVIYVHVCDWEEKESFSVDMNPYVITEQTLVEKQTNVPFFNKNVNLHESCQDVANRQIFSDKANSVLSQNQHETQDQQTVTGFTNFLPFAPALGL